MSAEAQDYGARLKSEAKFRSPQKAKPKPVTTITITFERMPVKGFTQGRVKMVFTRIEGVMLLTGRLRQLVQLDATIEHEYPGFGTAVLHPNDTFDWEKGMREAARDLVWCIRSGDAIFRAFRRWMWLAKQQWYIGKISPIDPQIVKYFTQDHYTQHSEDIFQPGKVIAREFGKVTWEVK